MWRGIIWHEASCRIRNYEKYICVIITLKINKTCIDNLVSKECMKNKYKTSGYNFHVYFPIFTLHSKNSYLPTPYSGGWKKVARTLYNALSHTHHEWTMLYAMTQLLEEIPQVM